MRCQLYQSSHASTASLAWRMVSKCSPYSLKFARKSYDLFLKEWNEKGHVHENYNAVSGNGDDVANSDRCYHWGALLGYVEYLERRQHSSFLRPHVKRPGE